MKKPIKYTKYQLLDFFRNCNKDPWNNTASMITWKLENRVLSFEPSNGETDWRRNLDFIPYPIWLNGHKVWMHRGFAKAWKEIRGLFDWVEIDLVLGYSQGGSFADCVSAVHDIPAVCFGTPKFFYTNRKAFDNALHIVCPRDIVTWVIPFLRKPRMKVVLKGKVNLRDEGTFWTRLSGHLPAEYIQRLESTDFTKSKYITNN